MSSDVGPETDDAVGPRRRDGVGELGGRSAHEAGAAGDESADLPSLSVVVVTYNEQDRIEGCLESVFEACGDEPTTEVILVDSNSTDSTVELARDYPATILQIPDDDLTTPGAGRYVGQQVATGDQTLFVDGDMRLSAEWLEDARRVVAERDDVAGVDGHLNAATSTAVEPVSVLRGVALYETSVLERVDGFDPFLTALEDIELGYRIVEEGYEMQRLPAVAASHPVTKGTGEVLRRWRNGYYFGMGQAVRKNLRAPRTLRRLVVRHRYPMAFLCWLVLGGAGALVQPLLGVAWLAVSLVLFAVDVVWEGRTRAVHRLGRYVLKSVGFVRGFLMAPRERAEFPVEAARLVEEGERVEA